MLFKILGIAIILVVLFLALALFVYYYDSNKRMKHRQPITKIDFNSKTVFGEVFTTHNLKNNKLTLVNIWGTYCGFCIKEMPDLQFIFEKYQDNGIGVLGIITDLFVDKPKDKELSTATRIIQDNSITYPNIYLDISLKEYLSGKVFLVPTTFFVDSDGFVVGDVIENVCTKEQLEELISKIDKV